MKETKEMTLNELEKELKEKEDYIEYIYEYTTKAFRQSARMRKKIAFNCDRIVELSNEIERRSKNE